MIDLGLGRADLRRYEQGLAASHEMRLRVRIHDRDEKPIASLTAGGSQVLEGEVTIDASADIKRQASLVILDEKGALDLDPYSPAEDALWIDKFVSIERLDWIDALGDFIACPVFWGPLALYERQGPEVSIEGLGKEALALHPAVLWRSLNFRKGQKMTQAIRTILREQGERRFDIPDGIDRKLPKRLSLGKMTQPWRAVQRLCRDLDRQGFYDGRGEFRIRRHPEEPVFVFTKRPREGEPAFILDDPVWSFDFERIRNVVEVLGHKRPKENRLRAVAKADVAHPLSAQSLARNGQPRFLVERVERDNVKRKQALQKIADRRLRNYLRSELDVTCDVLPVPHLEERDIVVIEATQRRAEIRLTDFTVPLTAEGTMTIGATKRYRYRKRRRRKGRR